MEKSWILEGHREERVGVVVSAETQEEAVRKAEGGEFQIIHWYDDSPGFVWDGVESTIEVIEDGE